MKDKILELRAQGKTYLEIKAELTCSLSTISYYCNPEQKEKTVQRTRDKRSKNIKFVQEFKQNAGCKDCGEMYPYYVLHFDHLGDKKFNVSMMMNRTLDEIKAEIAKCDVVCANCHAYRSYGRAVKTGDSIM
jgi:hypothetical protein